MENQLEKRDKLTTLPGAQLAHQPAGQSITDGDNEQHVHELVSLRLSPLVQTNIRLIRAD